jgi:thymidylate kinase
MLNTQLILINGMPGSGKSTTGEYIRDQLNNLRIPNQFYHELAENHPLRIYDRQFTSFTITEEAEWFVDKVKQLFSQFVQDRLKGREVAIIESYIFQDTIGFAYNMGMERDLLLELMESIKNILQELNPVLIYYYQENVEKNWRWICEVRGPVFAQERCGLYTDDDFIKAGEFWSANQEFVYEIVRHWNIPKIVIRNREYLWEEYLREIMGFLELNN